VFLLPGLSRHYSLAKEVTVWMWLMDEQLYIKSREPLGSPNSDRGIY
jgi:hypothetical protein